MKHPAQEPDRVKGKTLGIVALAVVVASTAGVLVVWGLGRHSFAAGAASRDVARDPSAMETAPFTAGAQGLEQQRIADAYLSSYGWVDRDRGIVHVPIDVAIEIYLARPPAPVSAPSAARTGGPR